MIREGAERLLLIVIVSFVVAVVGTRWFLQATGYPQVGGGELHVAHMLWGGLALVIAALLGLVVSAAWVPTVMAILTGAGTGLFIDEVGKFITASNDYFYPLAAPLIYGLVLALALVFILVRHREGASPAVTRPARVSAWEEARLTRRRYRRLLVVLLLVTGLGWLVSMAIVLAIDTPTLRQLIESVATVPGDRVERPTEPVFYVLEEAILGVGGLLLVTAAVVLARGRDALGRGARHGRAGHRPHGGCHREPLRGTGVRDRLHDRACRPAVRSSSTTATGSWRATRPGSRPQPQPERYGFGRLSQRSRVRPRTRGASPLLGPDRPGHEVPVPRPPGPGPPLELDVRLRAVGGVGPGGPAVRHVVEARQVVLADPEPAVDGLDLVEPLVDEAVLRVGHGWPAGPVAAHDRRDADPAERADLAPRVAPGGRELGRPVGRVQDDGRVPAAGESRGAARAAGRGRRDPPTSRRRPGRGDAAGRRRRPRERATPGRCPRSRPRWRRARG